MSKKMLIDATHKEETRIAITDGNKLIEYDYESQNRKPLKGSIFLAKVTRVEPSLQAAFVNFGGNRHGFLPFSEIHPDYFKIPVADREALMAEQEALLQEHDEEEALEDDVDDGSVEKDPSENDMGDDIVTDENGSDDVQEDAEPKGKAKKSANVDTTDADGSKVGTKSKEVEETSEQISDNDTVAVEDDKSVISGDVDEDALAASDVDGNVALPADKGEENGDVQDNENAGNDGDKKNYRGRGGRGRGGRGRGNKRSQYRNRNVEVVGGDENDGSKRFRFNLRRKYKIQEVVKRGQIMLVQVNKEERGNKGAAVGSYLSLPGRYCVLMPNSPRAGGVSRKIANQKDRARMKEIVKSLDIPKGMSVIVRTAGVTRTKAEIKRDLDYLMRLWNNIRELTLESTAPAIVYEEADLIKRSVRDLYTSDIDEVQVAGAAGYEAAKEFMNMLIPSHVKKVKHYESGQLPLFNRFQIESQINEIGQPEVRLKSGGYLVINPTEALVSVDVNSGKSTKGRHIEETALKTNLEAAEEVARQLKLRDLGGLVVIDFIDMEHRGNNAKVERRMKEALSSDRARVQVGRISSFGLMELSRQRLSPSLIESQFEQCHNCSGIGLVRTDDAMSIIVLRAIEEEGIRGRAAQVIVQVTSSVALYILNFKRKKLAQIEERYNLEVLLRVDDEIAASDYRVEVSKPAVSGDATDDASGEAKPKTVTPSDGNADADDKADGNRRRRGRRGGRNRNNRPEAEADKSDHNVQNENSEKTEDAAQKTSDSSEKLAEKISDVPKGDKDDSKDAKPKRRSIRRKKVDSDSSEKSAAPKKIDEKSEAAANDDSAHDDNTAKKPVRKRVAVKKKTDAVDTENKEKSVVKKSAAKKAPLLKEEEPSVASQHETVNQAPKKKKKGWWNR
ncbi:MAG: ribonuclease [Zetaproteobacteria bacterium]|nr:MAG: ribonuclease [Zetaproteobacteria bacterium]